MSFAHVDEIMRIRRLPRSDGQPMREPVIGIVPLFFYSVGLYMFGWYFDRKMPNGIRAGWFKRL